MSREIRSCFISAPFKADITNLRQSLLERGMRVVGVEDLSFGGSMLNVLRRAIGDADLVVFVVTQTADNSNLFFELGIAVGLAKRVVVFASPNVDSRLFDLESFLTVRAGLENRQAIDFALDQILAAPRSNTVSIQVERAAGQPLGQRSSEFLQEVQESSSNERVLEDLVSRALRASGVDVVVESQRQDRGFDLAVWSDFLQPFIGNPLLIEIKRQLRTKSDARNAIEQCGRAARRGGAKWCLLLYVDGPAEENRVWQSNPAVLAISIGKLLSAMREKSFVEVIRDLRNRRVHGGLF